MKSTSRIFTGLATVCGMGLLGSVLMAGQAAPQETSLPAEQYFKNVQVLKGLPVDEFLDEGDPRIFGIPGAGQPGL